MPASRAQRAQTAQRRARCLQMRLAGVAWDQIADLLGYASKGAACKDFDRAMKDALAEQRATAEQFRDLELMRYDRLTAAVWPAASKGEVKSVRAALDISRERVRLLGLDAAQRTVDNAVDAWIGHLAGGGLDADDAAALAAVA
jgi:hypothetical protein